MKFTQGDNAILNLTATDGSGNPVNLTGATFSTQIRNANGSGVSTFGNSQHAIVNAALGTFTLTLSPTDTLTCGVGENKEVVTQVTQSGLPVYFHGVGILTVLTNTPTQ